MKTADKKKHYFPEVTKKCTKCLFSLSSPGAFSYVLFNLWFINEPEFLWDVII